MTDRTQTGVLSADGIIEIQGPPAPPAPGPGPWMMSGVAMIILITILLIIVMLRKRRHFRQLGRLRVRLAAHSPVRRVLHELPRCLPADFRLDKDLHQQLQALRFSSVEPDRQQAIALLSAIESALRGRHAG